ncbi:MAG TPA: methyltransferase domain-containing protein [Planctomycetota bacterium]|jgi:ubiquinone/menaquinone biosynthesis C-methylase UbiE|nr:methyltransferase domain-containing protein [Planctomycetota bacterium]
MVEPREWRLDDAAAEFYEKHFVPALFADWASRLVDEAKVSPGQRILDAACGTGIVARTAADRIGAPGAVAGIDLNSSMIQVARRLRPDIEWHEGDVAKMPFADGRFDAVLCQAALMFFPDRVAALQEMRRVLRPGGKVAVQVWGASPGYELTAGIIEEASGKEAAEIFRAPFVLRDPREAESLLAKAGFRKTSRSTRQGAARFPSIDAMLQAEVDGWVLRGRVDLAEVLPVARVRLMPFCAASGAVSIPIEGHILTGFKP